MGRKITTACRGDGDWTATRYPDEYPDCHVMGFGETEQEAIDDLEEDEEQFADICRMNGYKFVDIGELVVSDTAVIDAVCLLSEKGLNWPDGGSKLTCIRAVNSLCKSLDKSNYPGHTEDRTESAAIANGYIKLEPGECVVKFEKWLPYLKKAYDAARLMEKHDAFTVKWYHNDWPSVEMLDELTAAIEGAANDRCGADNGR